MRAVAMLQGGDHKSARIELLRLWRKWADQDAPLQRCTIAHFLADTEVDAAAELVWDLLALKCATGFDDDQDRDFIDAALASFLPSLHLNVGDAYRRLGDRALQHVNNGLKWITCLDHDGYGNMVRMGLDRLHARLESSG